MTTDVNVVRTTIQKSFYRNGKLRYQVPIRDGCKHGLARAWHKNGTRASEEPYQNGLLHGLCRHWNEAGRLLGSYRMAHGTGIQRGWFDNGKLQIEISTVRGEFCGRNRIWLRDGTLISEHFYLRGRVVSAQTYREAAVEDKILPKFAGKAAKLPKKNSATQRHIHRVLISSLLEKRNRSEAQTWFKKRAGDKTARSLGHFKQETDAKTFVQELYAAGAVEVIVPDIYRNKEGDQFADCLLVHLPSNAATRKATRTVCAQLRKQKLGAVEPTEDIRETHLYLSLA